MASQLAPEILNPLKALLQEEAQPVLDTFLGDINAAGQKAVNSLPQAAQAPAGLGWTLFSTILTIAAHGELAVILRHNQPPAPPPAP
jgi:hypothetical protein